MNKFTFDVKEFGDVLVLYPEGYLNNITAERLEKECEASLKKGVRKVILNLSKVEFINSIGISILLSIIEIIKGSNGVFCFSNLSKVHEETFAVLDLKKHMQIFSTEDEALNHFKSKGRG
jgi:anti-anti-sigma factor